MGPGKTIVTIIEAAVIFRSAAWIVKSQHSLDRTQQMVRWGCVAIAGLCICVVGFERWADSKLGLFVLIGSLFLLLLSLMLPDCVYYLVNAIRRLVGSKNTN